MTSLLNRYTNGEFQKVWSELRSNEKLQGELAQEAEEVAAETMKRISFNADLLTERLITLTLPSEKADPIFENEEHNLPFVDYLRLCFRWGGFPKLEDKADGTKVQEFVASISRGFEPF